MSLVLSFHDDVFGVLADSQKALLLLQLLDPGAVSAGFLLLLKVCGGALVSRQQRRQISHASVEALEPRPLVLGIPPPAAQSRQQPQILLLGS